MFSSTIFILSLS